MTGKLVESNGVLLTTNQQGILRSADDGENWAVVISEGGVGIDVANIKGGVAAINYSTIAKDPENKNLLRRRQNLAGY